MVSTLSLEDKFNRVRRNFCFYLDIQDHGLARSLSRRLQDMGLQQEVFLTSRVTHVVREGSAGAAPCSARARGLVSMARPASQRPIVELTLPKAISLLDKLYDTFFAAPRKAHVRLFTKHYIKIEFLDKLCRPVFKEFDEWPEISLEPDPPKKRDATATVNDINQNHPASGAKKMTRKSRPRIKDKEVKEPKGGYCEMCNTDYTDAALHRMSPHHLAFVRDHNNFLALDTLIGAGADVETFLNKEAPVNGERRSLRKMCNGDVETSKTRSKRSQSPDSTVNGDSPKRNGLDAIDEKKHKTRCSKKVPVIEDRQYYKVVGVSTKLRSSGGFVTKRKDSPTQCNGNPNPLVVKFRKVRRSELSVLSDEAEQFMFPKRASSTSSNSSDDEDKEPLVSKIKTTPAPNERRRLARPIALKEESSEEDTWPEDKRRRRRRPAQAIKRGRRVPLKRPDPKPEVEQMKTETLPVESETKLVELAVETVSPLRDEQIERCMKWENGMLKYTPAVEQLEFAFESVPQSEPWFETFKRQDQDKVCTNNVPDKFALYTNSPKLPYEIGQLPPLKPNCCPLSDLVKRDERPGPSRSYGTRGMKKQKFRKRSVTSTLIALEGLSRKSPREHASTLAILGSALHRRKNGVDDAKSTASEDTLSDTISNVKVEPTVSETLAATERLKQFLSEVFDDTEEFEMPEETMEGETAVTTSTNAVDVSSLVSECENCDLIRNEIKENAENRARERRGKFKKKNKTGWPSKKKMKKGSRADSSESRKEESLDRSSAEPADDETTQDTIREEELKSDTEVKTEERVNTNEDTTDKISEKEACIVQRKTVARKRKQVNSQADIEKAMNTNKEEDEESCAEQKTPVSRKRKSAKHTLGASSIPEASDVNEDTTDNISDDESQETAKTPVSRKRRHEKHTSGSSNSSDEDRRKKKRALAGLLLQPVVRVARVDSNAARRLRSAGRQRSSRFR